ncbi:MAG: hypothetical protein KA204_04105 [Chromatiaceae bacterium]|nr:hypothetical protein [Chromatiaceae bacterium]MBP6582641.1 hypothetical protein [Chromatiaceae bacterium]MBP8197113.1 hypothetical protein [Chromatiaceae bacterium]MBP8282569.1 hypothetical protein [Chromatiaceae bacterium]MBP9603932.1 hypothetical protein [Chromatiaceae bacterium]
MSEPLMTRQQWFRLMDLALALRGTTTALLPFTGSYGGPEAKEEAERGSDLATASKLLADELYRLVDDLNEIAVYADLPTSLGEVCPQPG